MVNEQEKIPIKIRVDENISINMEIKKEMTSLEFLGLMTKAKKLFNISDREEIGIPSQTIRHIPYSKITDDVRNKMIEMRKSGTSYEAIAKEFGLNKSTIYNKFSEWKKQGLM